MKGVTVEKAGASFTIVDNLDVPEPSSDQILVKSLYAAFNPVDTYMQGTGLLVTSWPIVLGCDASGVVLMVGSKVSSFKVGDEVCGCTRLGVRGHSTFQEYFLMDSSITIKKPKNISSAQATTIGVGTLTASLGLFEALKLDLPDPKNLPSAKNEWLIVLGGSGSVGQYGVQLAKLCGFKVVASCSEKSKPLVTKLGADATIDYKKSEDQQIDDLASITGGDFNKIFDSTAGAHDFSLKAFAKSKATGQKYFATTNDWSDIDGGADIHVKKIVLGPLGREGAEQLDKDLASYIPVIEQLVEGGKIQPNEYKVLGTEGFEGVLEAVDTFTKGRSSAKIVVKLQDK